MTFARQPKNPQSKKPGLLGTPAQVAGWVLVTLIGVYVFLLPLFRATKSSNELAAGSAYSGQTPLPITLVSLAGAESLTPEQVKSARTEAMGRYPDLLKSGRYYPFDPIFDGIDPKLPWLSRAQLYFYGRERAPISIPARYQAPAAAEGLLNPLLLVEVQFWGLSVWGPANLRWDSTKATLEVLDQKQVKLAPATPTLTYNPEQSRAVAEYNVGQFLDQIKPFVVSPVAPESTAFGLSFQNARDLGFNYYYLDIPASTNIANSKQPPGPSLNIDYFGAVPTTWGQKGLINHLSGSNPSYDWIAVRSIPAKAVLKFWQRKPKDLAETADFTYEISIL